MTVLILLELLVVSVLLSLHVSSSSSIATIQSVASSSSSSSSSSSLLSDLYYTVKRFSHTKNAHQRKKKKVLILFSDTGGGHRTAAISLEKALAQIDYLHVDVELMDIWTEHGHYPFNTFVQTYRYLAKRPLLWRMFYAYGQFPPTKLFTEIVSSMVCMESFRKAIRNSDPDLIVSVHPLCQLMPLAIVEDINKDNEKLGKKKIRFVTIVTDLGDAHSTWFERKVSKIFVPSAKVKEIATKCGLKDDQIIEHGLPIRPCFWKRSRSKQATRKALGLKNVPTALLMGGGDGVGNLVDIATDVINKLSNEANKRTQVIVVTGHNKKMFRKLSETKWPDNVNVVIKGFCSNIHDYMTCSDCLVTKAGPGTIAEAMANGLPIILSSYLPGQEFGNLAYVVDGGFGYHISNPKLIAIKVSKLFFEDHHVLEAMSARAKELARPNATMEIAKDIANLL